MRLPWRLPPHCADPEGGSKAGKSPAGKVREVLIFFCPGPEPAI